MQSQCMVVWLFTMVMTTNAVAAVTEQDRELLNAVNRNQIARVAALLNSGADVNVRHPPLQLTPLLVASDVNFNADKRISLEIVSLLIARGAEVNVHDRDGLTPLMKAVGSYDLLVVKRLLDAGANINTRDQRGHSALTHAVLRSQPRMLALLIERGAQLAITADMGTTPWSIAQNMRAAAMTMPEHSHALNHAQRVGASVATDEPPPHAMRSKPEALADTQAVLEILAANGAVEAARSSTNFDAMATHRH